MHGAVVGELIIPGCNATGEGRLIGQFCLWTSSLHTAALRLSPDVDSLAEGFNSTGSSLGLGGIQDQAKRKFARRPIAMGFLLSLM